VDSPWECIVIVSSFILLGGACQLPNAGQQEHYICVYYNVHPAPMKYGDILMLPLLSVRPSVTLLCPLYTFETHGGIYKQTLHKCQV